MKTMKTIKIVLVAAILIAAQFAHSQSKSDRIYDAFSGKDGITNFSFSKNMVDAIDIDLGDEDEKNITGDLHQIRFMSYNPKKGSLSGNEFTKRAIGYLPKTVYKNYQGEEIDDDAEIWVLGKKKKFKECHLFINNQKGDQLRFVVSFYGDFNVNDLEGLKKTGKGFSDEN